MKKRKGLKIFLLLVAVLAALIYDSNTRIVVTEHTLSSPRLPEVFGGFTVVQLSDLHGAKFRDGNSELIRKTAAAEPDIIAITGDLADERADMAVIDSLMGELTEIAPVYYVTGNHEWGAGRMAELEAVFSCHGVRYLSNEYELFSRGEESIVIAGVEDPNAYADMIKPDEFMENLRQREGEKFTLLLGHRNYWAEKYPELEADVILCGHAHGGIVRLPFFGGVLGTGFELFPENVDGAAESGRYTMIVSRGLGNSIPVPRFLNNPEILVLRLENL